MLAGFTGSGGDKVFVRDADLVACRFVVDYREQEFRIAVSGNRIDVLAPEGDVLGTIRKGSSSTGAIWSYGSCVGEYRIEQGRYLVTEIQDGFLSVAQPISVDPLAYLLSSVMQASRA